MLLDRVCDGHILWGNYIHNQAWPWSWTANEDIRPRGSSMRMREWAKIGSHPVELALLSINLFDHDHGHMTIPFSSCNVVLIDKIVMVPIKILKLPWK